MSRLRSLSVSARLFIALRVVFIAAGARFGANPELARMDTLDELW
jgi:hypothetical protein